MTYPSESEKQYRRDLLAILDHALDTGEPTRHDLTKLKQALQHYTQTIDSLIYQKTVVEENTKKANIHSVERALELSSYRLALEFIYRTIVRHYANEALLDDDGEVVRLRSFIRNLHTAIQPLINPDPPLPFPPESDN